MIAPMRPDRYLKIAAAMRREGIGITVGFAGAAQRCPDRAGLVDELGTLTWRQLDERINALAAALQGLPSGQPKAVGIMCRNHRGFVEALVAANRIGSDIAAAQHVVRRAGAGRGGQSRRRRRRHLRRGVHRDGGPRVCRQTRRHPHRGVDRTGSTS